MRGVPAIVVGSEATVSFVLIAKDVVLPRTVRIQRGESTSVWGLCARGERLPRRRYCRAPHLGLQGAKGRQHVAIPSLSVGGPGVPSAPSYELPPGGP